MNRNFVLGLLIGSLGVLIALTLFPLHHSTSADTSRAVQLHEGWNLLVWTGDSQAADTALAPIADKMPIAYSWQADSRTFGLYVPNRPDISTMGQVEKDTGYWVLMVDGATLNVPTASLQCPQPSPCPEYSPCPTSAPCSTPTACPTSTPCSTGRCPPDPVDSNKCADALYEWAQSLYLSPIAEMDIELWCGEWPEMYVKCSSMPISRDKCAQALFDWAQSGFLSPIAEMDVELWC